MIIPLRQLRLLVVPVLAAAMVALPFLFRRPASVGQWKPGDPELIVISPHNEAIRHEFGRAFSDWHARTYGQPVRLDWRVIGGTSEIMRYLNSEMVSAFRAWWRAEGHEWPAGAGEKLLARHPPATGDPVAPAYVAYRGTDASAAFGTGIDVLFGGGVYDHSTAGKAGLLVEPWAPGEVPDNLFSNAVSGILIPESIGGESWRSPLYFGAAASTFGICYNADRIRQLGLAGPPLRWEDLTAPAYFRQLGVGDPTKSGSITKAFEMLIHEKCHTAVRAAGFTAEQVAAFEAAIDAAGWSAPLPPEVPLAYQAAVERGWLQGVWLAQQIGANARYFTDGAGRVPVDVSMGNAAAGLCIDFYGRFQAEVSRRPDGREVMAYITPEGGSSVSADPISMLRGAPHPEIARHFLEFVLGEAGQKLWNYRVGEPGGPVRYALRRLPVRRDFYPSDDPAADAISREHARHCVDDLRDPAVDPFRIGSSFTYYPRWTARHFGAHRLLVRAMCMDASEELKAAWLAICSHGGPAAQPAAMALLQRMPEWPAPVTWSSIPAIVRSHDTMDLNREWTLFFRRSYHEALAAVEVEPPSPPDEGGLALAAFPPASNAWAGVGRSGPECRTRGARIHPEGQLR